MFCGYIKSCRLEIVYRCCCLLLSMLLLLWWNFTVGSNASFIFSSLTSGIVVGLQVEGFGALEQIYFVAFWLMWDVDPSQEEFTPPPTASRPLNLSGRLWVFGGSFDRMETIGDRNRTEAEIEDWSKVVSDVKWAEFLLFEMVSIAVFEVIPWWNWCF